MKVPHLSELRKEYARSSGRVHWIVRGILWLGAAWVIWVLAGFFVLPSILRSQLQTRLSAELHRPVTVGKVSLNPLVLSVTVEDFKLAAADGGPFSGWKRLYVNFDAFSFLLREWRFQAVELDGFSGAVAVARDGRLNFADLLERINKPSKTAKKTKASWPLLVRRLAVTDAQLDYRDESQDGVFETKLGPTTFLLRDFHTGGPRQAPGEFSVTTESGESFSWRGNIAVAPLRSAGTIRVGQLALKKYAPFYSKRTRFDLLDGRLDALVRYEFSMQNGEPLLRFSEGKITLDALKIAKRGESSPVIALDKIEVTDAGATWPAISANVARVTVTGGSLQLQRDASGIDIVHMLAPAADGGPAVAVVAQPVGSSVTPIVPDVKIGGITVRGLNIAIEDQTTPRPAQLQLTELSCDLRGFSLAEPATAMPFGLRVRPAAESEIHVAGTLTLAPLKAQLGVELTSIPLALLSPYVETFANLRIGKGRLTTALYVGIELPREAAPVISAQGDLNIENFAAHDADVVDEIASWRGLSIKGFEYSSEPAKVLINEIAWIEPVGHFIINSDGRSNLALALRGAEASGVSESVPAITLPKGRIIAPTDVTGGVQVSLERFVLEKAMIDFTDRSLQPNVHVTLNQLSGQIEGLASSELARATVDLRGRIDGITPIAITGKTNPLSVDAFTDLKVTMKGMELVTVGAYVGKFAGYELERGSLTLDIKYHINKRKIVSTNVATIDQFTFGKATNSVDATKLPVRLAVALLRDTAGRIVLDIPMQGSLDDPNFRMSRVVLRVITNLLAKAATSPFAMLGSMFGSGKGEELSFQAFLPGEDTPVNDEEIKKLDVVAKALRERPTLRLEIVGGFDESFDAPVLKDQALENQMKNIVWNDRRMVDPSITLDQIQIDPVQKNGMIRRLFYKAFPKEKPKRPSPGDPGYEEEAVVSQRGNLGAFQRKKRAVAPVAQQVKAATTSEKTNPDGTTEASSEVKEIKPPTFEEMKNRLLALMNVDEEAYRKLAADRAGAVRQYLINYGEVPAERLSLAAITSEQPAAKGARVELRLK